MQTDAPPIAHFVTRMVSIDGNHEPFEIEVIIRRGTSSEVITDKVKPMTMGTGRRGSTYVHSFTTNLSDANKQGLDNMVYWGTGPRKSKTYLINQALTQFLAQYKESQQPIPLEEA